MKRNDIRVIFGLVLITVSLLFASFAVKSMFTFLIWFSGVGFCFSVWLLWGGNNYMLSRDELFAKCIKQYGKEANIRQLVEECAELIVAVNHLSRGKCSKVDLLEEMIDVQMMLDICKDIYGFTDKEWDSMMRKKLKVVERRLKK